MSLAHLAEPQPWRPTPSACRPPAAGAPGAGSGRVRAQAAAGGENQGAGRDCGAAGREQEAEVPQPAPDPHHPARHTQPGWLRPPPPRAWRLRRDAADPRCRAGRRMLSGLRHRTRRWSGGRARPGTGDLPWIRPRAPRAPTSSPPQSSSQSATTGVSSCSCSLAARLAPSFPRLLLHAAPSIGRSSTTTRTPLAFLSWAQPLPSCPAPRPL